MPDNTFPRTVMIGSYVPRRCGIATFTRDVGSAIEQACRTTDSPNGQMTPVVAMNDRDNEYKYGPEVMLEVHQQRRDEYRNAAEVLNNARVDAVSVQHEYGIFGGDCGEYLFDLLDRLKKPVISTLHSILSEPSPKQREVLIRLCDRSSSVVVMANRARMILNDVYGVSMDRLRLIPHGVPDVPFGDTEPWKERFDLTGRPMILTFGLLGPGKGIETMLEAMADVVPHNPDVAYVILGVTHPNIMRESGEFYRISLERRAVELGIQKNVLFHNRYVTNEDLYEYLQAADIYVTPYRAKEQITSGTLAYALAAGKAIVSTPYWHAQELLINGRGRLVDFDDAKGFAKNIRELLENEHERKKVQKAAYDFGRSMIWSRVGEEYVKVIDRAVREYADSKRSQTDPGKILMRMSLPSPHLDHLFAMSDDTGMLQHAIYATPDRRHGYCTDDNARALIVAAMACEFFQNEQALPYLRTYLSFIQFALISETGRFRNFMSYDRRWLEDDGSDDCQGRVMWALGYLVSHAPDEGVRSLSTDLFRAGVPSMKELAWTRSWSLSMLGGHYYLRKYPEDTRVRQWMTALSERLMSEFAKVASDDWPWISDKLTYDNGRLPQALIIAGHTLDRPEMVDLGLHVLRWLVEVQTAPQGHLSIIGNDGWMTRDGQRAQFDQQPLEPAAMIGACKAAFRASGDSMWLSEMRRCFEWYVGRNDLGLSMVDFKSRGCFDGLTENGVNENQGAESVLSWLLSLLIMHEMQTGDAPEVG